jgi:VIT1/CCC1 family predicted Fe2+/Mn2+ transporter
MKFLNIASRKGIGFGLTSGVITTLGVVTGLNSTTGLKSVVIAGILTIAIADAFSDSLGVHISEESGSKTTNKKSIWQSTISTFFTKFFVALTFLIPILLFNLKVAVGISIIWGLLLISIFSYYITKKNKASPTKAVLEHLFIAIVVILLTSNIKYIINFLIGN